MAGPMDDLSKAVKIRFKRNVAGVRVWVHAHKSIEDFVKAACNGETAALSIFTKKWIPVDNTPQLVYSNGERIIPTTTRDCSFTFESLGEDLEIIQGGFKPQATANLSMLRFVGISQPTGCTFDVAQVYSWDGLRNAADLISVAAREFYVSFVRPGEIEISVEHGTGVTELDNRF